MKIQSIALIVVKNDVEESKSKEILPEGRRTHEVASAHFKDRVKEESTVRNGIKAFFLF